jgi:hypothetical protein
MKRLLFTFLLFAILLLPTALSYAQAEDQWLTFSDNLINALKSGNEGLQISAMQLVVRHADNVWVHEAAYDIYQIFCNHENQRVRQLALVTLYKIQNNWVLQCLCRDIKKETNPTIKHQMLAIIQQQQAFLARR